MKKANGDFHQHSGQFSPRKYTKPLSHTHSLVIMLRKIFLLASILKHKKTQSLIAHTTKGTNAKRNRYKNTTRSPTEIFPSEKI